jgi:hypothetical protein
MRFRIPFAAGLVTLLALSAHGQDVGGTEQVGNSAALEQRIAQLEDRLRKLEERLEKPMTVKAPFVVADGSGKPVFRISHSGGYSLTLGPDAAPLLRVNESGSEAVLKVTTGSGDVTLRAAKSGTSIVSASNGKNYARIISDAGVAAAEVKQGGEIGQLSIFDGSSRLKLWKADKPYFLASQNQGAVLVLGEEASPGFTVKAGAEETTMKVSKGVSFMQVRSEAEGTQLDVRNGQASSASMNALSGSSKIQVTTPMGGNAIQMMMTKDKPSLTVFEGGKRNAELSAPEGRATGLRFYDPQGDIALQAGLGTNGKPSVTLFEKNDGIAALALNNAGEGVLEIYRPGEQIAVQLGRTDADKGLGLRIFDASGKVAVGAGFDNKGVANVRVMQDSRLAASMEALSSGDGLVEVRKAGAASAMLAVAKDGSGAVVVKDSAGGNAAVLSADGGEGSLDLFRPGGKQAISLGVEAARKTALRVYGDSAVVAAIGLDTNGLGAMRLSDSKGNSTVALTSDSDGGGAMAIFDAKHVLAAALAIDSDGEGAVQVYGNDQVLATLGRGNNGGILQLNNNAGEPMVDAGNIGTVGVVRAGPIIQASGMPGLPGSFLMGRRQP